MAVELAQGSPLDARHTAEQFGVSTRTFFRDLQELGNAGLTVVLDDEARAYTLRALDWE
jgi:predicted DNA-binding transcriptional regulator YafY